MGPSVALAQDSRQAVGRCRRYLGSTLLMWFSSWLFRWWGQAFVQTGTALPFIGQTVKGEWNVCSFHPSSPSLSPSKILGCRENWIQSLFGCKMGGRGRLTQPVYCHRGKWASNVGYPCQKFQEIGQKEIGQKAESWKTFQSPGMLLLEGKRNQQRVFLHIPSTLLAQRPLAWGCGFLEPTL